MLHDLDAAVLLDDVTWSANEAGRGIDLPSGAARSAAAGTAPARRDLSASNLDGFLEASREQVVGVGPWEPSNGAAS